MLKYLGITKELDDNPSPTTTTFQVTFVENDKVTEVKFAELTKFMGEYYGLERPQISITWNLTYNFDSTVLIRLKFQYLDIEWPNDMIRQERLNEVLIAEFEIVYKKFFEPKLFKLGSKLGPKF
ncbi:MAG: hypothetical protein K8E24_004045 [Methanobacterium paludis]|nr:hypothetical protein [Methanobacterium paludis]